MVKYLADPEFPQLFSFRCHSLLADPVNAIHFGARIAKNDGVGQIWGGSPFFCCEPGYVPTRCYFRLDFTASLATAGYPFNPDVRLFQAGSSLLVPHSRYIQHRLPTHAVRIWIEDQYYTIRDKKIVFFIDFRARPTKHDSVRKNLERKYSTCLEKKSGWKISLFQGLPWSGVQISASRFASFVSRFGSFPRISLYEKDYFFI